MSGPAVPWIRGPPEHFQSSKRPGANEEEHFCRICFKGGKGLIAPCVCRGTSKWVHRSCLDQWRLQGANPRAMTRCCECGFRYQLQLQVCNEAIEPAAPAKDSTPNSCKGVLLQVCQFVVVTQLSIVGFALLTRSLDQNEVLVQNLALTPAEKAIQPGTFWNALRVHKVTYYFAGLLSFVFVLAMAGLSFLIIPRCVRPRPGTWRFCDCCLCLLTVFVILRELWPGKTKPQNLEYVVQDLSSFAPEMGYTSRNDGRPLLQVNAPSYADIDNREQVKSNSYGSTQQTLTV